MGGARLVARVPHTHLVPKGHGLVRVLMRVLRCDVRHNTSRRNAAFSALARRPSGIAPSSANLITATLSFSTCAIVSRQDCAALEKPALLDREPASGGLRALRFT